MFIDVYKSLLSGSISGFISTIFAHPVDTIKTRFQSSSLPIKSILLDLYKNEGIRGFYKGLLFPSLISIPSTAVIFAGNNLSSKIIKGLKLNK